MWAWRGSEASGTFQGSLHLKVEGNEATVDFTPAKGVQDPTLVVDLLIQALAAAPGVSRVYAGRHLGGARGLERLYRQSKGISFE